MVSQSFLLARGGIKFASWLARIHSLLFALLNAPSQSPIKEVNL
jgi:hypothetical protein